jgi:hypothetical protein
VLETRLKDFDLGQPPASLKTENTTYSTIHKLLSGKKYQGWIKQGLPHGKGVLIAPNEATQIAWFKSGL